MTRHLPLVSQPVESEQHGVVADWLVGVSAGEYIPAAARNCLEFRQDGKSLSGKRDEVFGLHLHSTSGNTPERLIQIELRPFRTDQLIGADKGLRQQLQREASLLPANFVVP